ncbi:MAG: Fe-S cluster assembly protein SufD [Geminicoccaceae bacterium]
MATTARSIVPEARYAALFGTALPQLPGARHAAIRRLREASFDRFMTLGFPGPKSEAWKYTSVGPLARARFDLAPRLELRRADVQPYLVRGARCLVFLNGRFAAHLSDDETVADGVTVCSLAAVLERGDPTVLDAVADTDSGRAFSALNAALAADGCLIRLGDGVALDRPVQLLFMSVDRDPPAVLNPRNVVIVGDGARLNLIESHVMPDGGRSLTNLVNHVVVGRGAELRHDRLQTGAAGGTLIGQTHYGISADARLTQSLATLGGALVRNEIRAVMQGGGSAATLNGLYFTRDHQHVDNHILVDHAAPGSTSDQFYKGILDDHSQGVFAGKIVVRRDAQKTNAYQSNNNLLLSSDAEIDTKPELEIFADDVKCSHGATAGELDERELFYLRSRGLDVATARSVLTFAFAGEVLERFGNPAIAQQAKAGLLARLPGGEALGELA